MSRCKLISLIQSLFHYLFIYLDFLVSFSFPSSCVFHPGIIFDYDSWIMFFEYVITHFQQDILLYSCLSIILAITWEEWRLTCILQDMWSQKTASFSNCCLCCITGQESAVCHLLHTWAQRWDVHDWLVPLWLTGKREYDITPIWKSMIWTLASDGHGITGIKICDLFAIRWRDFLLNHSGASIGWFLSLYLAHGTMMGEKYCVTRSSLLFYIKLFLYKGLWDEA